MTWTEPYWWILFIGACASFVLSLVNIAWTWKQAKRLDETIDAQRNRIEAACRLIVKLREWGDARVASSNEWMDFVSVSREEWEAVFLAEKWGAVKKQWHAGTLMVRAYQLGEPK